MTLFVGARELLCGSTRGIPQGTQPRSECTEPEPSARLWLSLVLVVACGSVAAQPAFRDGRIPFWLELHADQQIDVQARRQISEHGVMAVLRVRPDSRNSNRKNTEVVAKLREAAPDVPVLIYGWVSRYLKKGCTGDRMMNWLVREPDLQLQTRTEKPTSIFGDVRKEAYRRNTVTNIRAVLDSYAADGVAIDLAVRTPKPSPSFLSRRCRSDSEFCRNYANGMDSLFEQLHETLRGRKILYNGIWNFRDGMIEDQTRLLSYADGAIVEYFGMQPNEGKGSFGRDIAPYLDVMDRLAPDKHVFVYGRGPWRYENYGRDYLRQRYLFGSYLLAARENTAFKYHATFQVPTQLGRSGGLDIYADTFIELGLPVGARRNTGDLKTRLFAHGQVLVSPDDGEPGTAELNSPMYTPEGLRHTGSVTVAPGSALILLNEKPEPMATYRALDLESLADWSGADWKSLAGHDGYLELKQISDPQLQGDHDLLLDGVRSFAPFLKLNLRVHPRHRSSRLLIVAEVDDPEERETLLVFCLGTGFRKNCAGRIDAPRFRMPMGTRNVTWPGVRGPEISAGQPSDLVLDGRVLLKGTRFRFRRWAYLRLEGPWRVYRVGLSRESQT